jgi:hypothetical protein
VLEAKQPQWERHETNFTTNKVFQAIQNHEKSSNHQK